MRSCRERLAQPAQQQQSCCPFTAGYCFVVVNHKYKLRNQRGTINANILLLFREVYVHKTDVEMHCAFGG